MRLTKEELAALCRTYGSSLHLPAGLNGVQMLWAFAGRESSFGARCVPLYATGVRQARGRPLIEERLAAGRVPALPGSKLESFAHDGRSRVLEVEFRVTAPHTHGEIPLRPPPRVIQYFDVPRYVLTRLMRPNARAVLGG